MRKSTALVWSFVGEFLKRLSRKRLAVKLFTASAVLASLVLPVAAAAQDQSILQAAEPVKLLEATVDEARTVFGSQLFGGEFANQSFVGFNPDYQVTSGDKVTVTMWGGFDFTAELIVDLQGNIFIPSVGPVRLSGVRNIDLNIRVSEAVKKVYKKNVGVYSSLNGAEPVKVFVTGFARQPGLYAGHSSDSILFFLDRAGGIDAERGSYLSVRVLRSGREIQKINLYDFIVSGDIPVFQIRDGDTIVVDPVRGQVDVTGQVQNAYRYEFEGEIFIKDLFELASVKPSATHVRIERNSRAQGEVEYMTLAAAMNEKLDAGDRVEVVVDKLPGTISVRVEGEHDSIKEYILPYGASLSDLLSQIDFGKDAERESIQLLRESVRARQKDMLEARLRALESSVLTARAKSESEANLRKIEAELILKWLDRARQVEPRGQVTLAGLTSYDDLLLEPGDIVRIPRKSNLILIHGDVLFPSAVPFQGDFSVNDYVAQSGGYSQPKSATNVLILHRDGTFQNLTSGERKSNRIDIRPGDEIFVLPKVQTKSFQLAKDIFQVVYQLALSAGVVLSI